MHHPSSPDRVALVTGGARGVGREVVRTLAGRGYAVAVGYDRHRSAAEAVVDEVLEAGGRAVTVRADVADELDVERLFAETVEAFGRVDVVVHAAALVAGDAAASAASADPAGPVPVAGSTDAADLDLDCFDAVQRTNVRSTFVVDRQAARRLGGGGAIVNVSGPAADRLAPLEAADASSRGAVEAMTRVFARQLSDRGITVNAVAAGEEGPRAASAMADVVALLVSAEGRSLNGQVIRVETGAG